MGSPEVGPLEDEIDKLADLDRLRVRSAEMRNRGRDALLDLNNERWQELDSSAESALIVKALCDRRTGTRPPEELVTNLERVTCEEIFGASVKMPVLRAARSMQALAAAPSSAFSEALLLFYYQIIREIYSADMPDWRVGGARAAVGGSASAYVTGECVRALLSFVRTLEDTGGFLEEVRKILERGAQLKSCEIPMQWCKTETARLNHDFYTTITRLSGNLAIKINFTDLKLSTMNQFLEKVPEQIADAIGISIKTFRSAKKRIEELRTEEERKVDRQREEDRQKPAGQRSYSRSSAEKQFERSATGHAVALGAIDQAIDRAEDAAKLFATHDRDLDAALQQLATMFRSAGASVRKLIHPAKSFLSTVLDRELAAAASEGPPDWDPGEMAFAAASYGFAAGSWDDDRLRRAGLCLSEALRERGHFPASKPFHVDSQGTQIQVSNAEVLRAFAQLMEHVHEIPIECGLVKRMLYFFEDTRKDLSLSQPSYGWHPAQMQQPASPTRKETAFAVLALDRLNRLLDERINSLVFRHFFVRRSSELKDLDLRTLFYPDYGLRPSPKESLWSEESVALSLERMRSHVFGVWPPEPGRDPLFSMVLHGPPGTGKTTLVEALARSCGVPLVEVTPSDIVSGGADAVERRARAVFKALSLLTRVVVMFDEFDPVLRRREPKDRGPSTVFSFLTPGMLPKLKNLHDQAGKRGVSYILITNLIGTLDEAAVRAGRFDRLVGIYPPDPLSRAGRLVDQLLAFERKTSEKRPELETFKARVQDVVRETAGAPMEFLARKGWFVRPKSREDVPEDSPFEHVLKQSAAEFKPQITAEAVLKEEIQGEGVAAEREYQQWAWVRKWDENGAWTEERQLDKALGAMPNQIPETPRKKGSPLAFLTWGKELPPEGTEFVVLYGLEKHGNGQPASSAPDS